MITKSWMKRAVAVGLIALMAVVNPLQNLSAGDAAPSVARAAESDNPYVGEVRIAADKDPEKAAILSSILAYKDIIEGAVPVEEECEYTNQVLARSGFFWSNPDETYIRKFIEALSGMAFFDGSFLYR